MVRKHTHTNRVLISLGVHCPVGFMCFDMKACSRTLGLDITVYYRGGGNESPPAPPPAKPHQTLALKGTPPPVITQTIRQRGKGATALMVYLNKSRGKS